MADRSRLTAALALGATALALAATPGTAQAAATIAIETPAAGSVTNQATPSFSGTSSGSGEVTLTIYAGPTPRAPVAEVLGPVQVHNGAWSLASVVPLVDGTYTARASSGVATSEAILFTILTASPAVSLDPVASPRAGTPTFTGHGGQAPGDGPTVTVDIFTGESATGAPLSSGVAAIASGRWAYTGPPLAAGTYTARAVQGDSIGNPPGMSAAQTFTIDTTPPAASFIWLPTAPYAGEAVSFASTATDPLSPITALAWDLGTGAFAPGGPVASTTFAAPGSHLVRLSATDAIGLSSVSSRTISVRPRPLPVMVPFPIVRLVGSERRAGTLIRLLAVEAPSGTSVSVTCRGRGCPRRAQRRIAPATRAGTAWLTFARFERLLRPGIFLAVRVFHPNEIGAYTSIAIRRGKLPHRVDECLDPVRNAPVRCSS